ncbi:arylsulfatase B-like [Centruroides sculpturatus]|uniref:arylsulfatase B-like n=1 Tax=Centruroides sculpturatus TaxID=218467 RepID=UPI000C6CE6E7|nr:arylsulfatase B-like [Centruroides sculpturatus]
MNCCYLFFILVLIFTSNRIYCTKPHIVFILADDLGWNDVSFHGFLQIPTPNIDVLASNGVILNNYYVQPLCTPSRAALLSGRHPIHLGLQHWILYGAQPAGLPLDVKIMPEFFKKFNYSTHIVGKWHLGFHKKEYLPTYRGFDSHFGFWLAKMDYYDHTSLDVYENSTLKYAWGDVLRDNMKIVSDLKGHYSTHLFTNRAVDIIKKHNTTQPLFLYVAPSAPHSGNRYSLFQAPFTEISKFSHIRNPERRIYAATVSELDKLVGEIFEALDHKKMLDNTIFVFSSDNGAETGFRKGVGSNWPLRGIKATLWEGGIRAVGIVWSKLIKHQPRIENSLMHITDWLPTLYHAAGGDINDLSNIYGINQWNSISEGIPSSREELLLNIDPIDKASALRVKNYKIVNGSNLNGHYNMWYGAIENKDVISISDYEERLSCSIILHILHRREKCFCMNNCFSELKVKCNPTKEKFNNCNPNISPCLFDVRNDPCEINNIADRHPQIVQSMLKRLKELESTAVPIVKQDIDPLANPSLYQFVWTNWLDKN